MTSGPKIFSEHYSFHNWGQASGSAVCWTPYYRFAKILLQFPQCSLFSKSPFFKIIRRLSRTWQPKTKSLNLSRTIIDSFSFRRPHYLRSENSTQLGAWVGGVTERLWLGCRPDFVFLWVPATVSGGRLLLRRRDKSLEAQFWDSHLQFLTSPRPPELRFESWEANSSKK